MTWRVVVGTKVGAVAIALVALTSCSALSSAPGTGTSEQSDGSVETQEQPGVLGLVSNLFSSNNNQQFQTSAPAAAVVSADAGQSVLSLTDTARTSQIGAGPNRHLWRATFEVLNFMPMALADPTNGIIQTNWKLAPNNTFERMRVEVYVLSDRLQADALRVNTYRQSFDPLTGAWQDAPTNPSTARQLENRILERAFERQASLGFAR